MEVHGVGAVADEVCVRGWVCVSTIWRLNVVMNTVSPSHVRVAMAGFFSQLFSPGAVLQQEVKHPNVVQQQVGRSASGSRECIKFLVCGPACTGRSALINSLVGREVCRVYSLESDGPRPATTALTEVRSQLSILMNSALVDSPGQQDGLGEGNASNLEHLNSTDLILIDSPGLMNGDGKDDQHLDAMYQKCKDADLFLYCVDMTMTRFGSDVFKSLELFTKKFGPDFWKCCVLVMTKANRVVIPSHMRTTNKEKREYHRKWYNKILKTFREELKKIGVSATTTDNIPACAAGSFFYIEDGEDKRYIWYASNSAEPSYQPVYFLPELWKTCLERLPEPTQKKLFLIDSPLNMNPKMMPIFVIQKMKKKLQEEKMESEKIELESRHEQMLKKKNQQIEEITRRLDAELTSTQKKNDQEKKELEQLCQKEKRELVLKLTSAQEKEKKMEELLAKHEQEKRELESKHKEMLKKKDKEKIEMEHLHLEQVEEMKKKHNSELASAQQKKRELIKDQEMKLSSAQGKEKMEGLLWKHEQEKRELLSRHEQMLKKKDQEKVEMEHFHLKQVEEMKKEHNSELASAQQKNNQEKRELEQTIEDRDLTLTSVQEEKKKMESNHKEMLKKKDEEKIEMEHLHLELVEEMKRKAQLRTCLCTTGARANN